MLLTGLEAADTGRPLAMNQLLAPTRPRALTPPRLRAVGSVSIGALLLALSGLGCATTSGAGPTNAEAAREPEPDPNRSVDTPGGHVTFGFQATPVDQTRVRVTGVLVDLDGQEHVTDLGEWEGELTIVEGADGELLHLHLEGGENHEFVAVPVGDSDLDLLVDGERVGRLHFEAAALIEADEPLRLTTPRLLEE